MSTFLDIENKTDAPEKLQKIQEAGITPEQTITAEEFNKIVTAINKLKALLGPLATVADLNQRLASKLNLDFSNVSDVQLNQIRTLLNAGNTSASHELLECIDSIVPGTTSQKIVILADNASTIDTNNYQVQFFDGATQLTIITATNIFIPNNESIVITVDATNVPLGTYEVKVISGIASNLGSCEVIVGTVTENPVSLSWNILLNGTDDGTYLIDNGDSIAIKLHSNYNFSVVSNAVNPNGEDFDLTFQLETPTAAEKNRYCYAWFGISKNNTSRLPSGITGVYNGSKKNSYGSIILNKKDSIIGGATSKLLGGQTTDQVKTRIIKRGEDLMLINYNITTGSYFIDKINTDADAVFYLKSSCHSNTQYSVQGALNISNINIKHI